MLPIQADTNYRERLDSQSPGPDSPKADNEVGEFPALGPSAERFPAEPPSSRLLSFPVTLAIALAVLMVLTVRSRFNDPDLWWHLKTGEVIYATHSIPRMDLFSFTTNQHSWVAHEWLSELTLFAVWKLGGYAGLMLWFCACTSVLIIVAYILCSLYSGSVKVGFLGALVVWFFATVGLGIRPQLLGYLLLVCEFLILHLARSRDLRWSLLLPPIFALWVNCHGSFIFGVLVLAVVLTCSFLDLNFGLVISEQWPKQARRMLTMMASLSVFSLFLNPIGIKLVLYPLNLMFDQRTNLGVVSEWQPVTFNNVRGLGLLAVLGVVLFLASFRRARLRLEELSLLLLGFGMAIAHERMLFVFGIVAAPVLSRLAHGEWDRYDAARDRRLPNAVMIVISLVVVLAAFPRTHELQAQVREHNPVQAVEFIRSAGLSGNMLNDYNYGGYLIWALPEHKVFLDGRTDIFDWTGVLRDFASWALLQADPVELLKRYQIRFCLISRDAPMAHVMQYLPGWKKVYSDKLAVVFVKSAEEN